MPPGGAHAAGRLDLACWYYSASLVLQLEELGLVVADDLLREGVRVDCVASILGESAECLILIEHLLFLILGLAG